MKKMANTHPIKIMRIIARMNVGGPAIQITNMLNGLAPDQFEQRLYFGTCDAGEAEHISDIRDQSLLHRIPSLQRSVHGLSEIAALLHLIMEIKSFKPDVIHTHTAKAGFLGRLAAMLSGSSAKRVHTFHGHVLHGYFSPFLSFIYALVERFLARHTDVIISVGPQVKADLLKFRIGNPEKHKVIFPGISVGQRIPQDEARKELGLLPKKLTLAFIGRFTSIKRIDRIVELARLSKRNQLDVQFLCAGQGPELEKIRDIARFENLPMVFLGWRSDIERVLSASDALLLTSDNEGTPIASIQASLLGIPTLATNVGSLQDIVITEQTGLLTTPTVVDLFVALTRLYNDKQLLENLGAQAKAFASREFSLKHFLSQYSIFYFGWENQTTKK
jgi:glycosyltransferase involved in cell wall biosynthesis